MDLNLEEVRCYAKELCNIEEANILCATLSQIVQVLGLGIAGGCGLFLLGNYGVQGDFTMTLKSGILALS